MNAGQILETHLGWAAEKLGVQVATLVFNGATEDEIGDLLEAAGLPRGYAYMMKLSKLVDDIGYCPLS